MTEEKHVADEVTAADDAVASEADAPEAAESTDEPIKAEGEEKRKRNRKTFQERISEVTRARREAEARAEAAEKALEAERSRVAKAPRPEDFDTDDAYERARQKHIARELRAEDAEDAVKAAREAAKRENEAYRKEVLSDFHARAAEFVGGDTREFFDKVGSAPIPDGVALAVAEMDDGPAVALHLADNPALAREIAAMSPYRAGIALAKVSAALSKPRPKVKSAAPPPVQGVKGGNPSIDLSKASYAEYRAARMAQMKGQ